MRRVATVLLALALPWEGHTSGSSTVTATGAHLAVSLESARKIFANGEGEGDWHASWVAEHQPEVDAALARLEPALASAATAAGLSLAPYADTLPEAWAWAGAGDSHSVATVCAAGPCRVRVQLWSAGVSGVPTYDVAIALGAVPAEGAVDRVTVALAHAVGDRPAE